MPVDKFRRIEDMPPLPVSGANLAGRIRSVWRRSRLFAPRMRRTPGVQRFRTIEEAGAARESAIEPRYPHDVGNPEKIVSFVERTWPKAVVALERLPSGAFSIDIRLDTKLAVVQFSPSGRAEGRYGASLLRGDEPPFMGHDRSFGQLDDVCAYLTSILSP